MIHLHNQLILAIFSNLDVMLVCFDAFFFILKVSTWRLVIFFFRNGVAPASASKKIAMVLVVK